MNTETMTAEGFAAKLGNDVAHFLGWIEVTATAVDSTGGGCTATRIDFTDTGRTCSLVLVDDENAALDGEWLNRAYKGDAHRDGERAIVAVYNGGDWHGSGLDYTGTDILSDYAFTDYGRLVDRCASELRNWGNASR
jgi:hypothetical protein